MWATELAAAGHEVWVITRTPTGSAIEAELECGGRNRAFISSITICALGTAD